MNIGLKPPEVQETPSRPSKVELLKTMVKAKKKQWNYSRWLKHFGSDFGISGIEAKKDWDTVK